jgi:hypothetical protein
MKQLFFIPLFFALFAGTPSIAQDVIASKQLYTFDVTRYGAVADGTTDNTTAFTNCMAALVAAGGGTFYVPPIGVFVGKITVPANNTNTVIPITILGAARPSMAFGTVSGAFALNTNTGSIVKSTATSGAVISVAQNTGTGNFQGFSNILLTIKNLDIRTYDNPQINGIDVFYSQQNVIEDCFVNTGVFGVAASFPSNGKTGIITPENNNGAYTIIRNTVVSGYYTGIAVNEHTNLDYTIVAECVRGYDLKAAFHLLTGSAVKAYSNTYNMYVSGVCRFIWTSFNLENETASTRTGTAAWQITVADIKDSANLATGNLYWAVTTGNAGITHTFVKSGGSGILVSEVGTAPTASSVALSNTQLGYGSSGGVLTGSPNMTYDGTSINMTQSAQFGGLSITNSHATGGAARLSIKNNLGNGLYLSSYPSGFTAAANLAGVASFAGDKALWFLSNQASASGGTDPIIFSPGGFNNEAIRISTNKDLLIGTTTSTTSSILTINSTTKGVLLPRMTKTQRDAISTPIAGLAIYQTDNTPGLRVYNGTNWMRYTETAD